MHWKLRHGDSEGYTVVYTEENVPSRRRFFRIVHDLSRWRAQNFSLVTGGDMHANYVLSSFASFISEGAKMSND